MPPGANNTRQDNVRELQVKLYLAAKRSPGRRFHALWDRICRRDVLERAWQRVRENRGSAGVDRITIAQIEERGVQVFLDELEAELREGTYRPVAVRRVHIPKPGRLRDITAPKVAAWRAQRQRDGAGAKALREAHSLLGGILGYACELGELEQNAARAVRPSRRPSREPVRAWAPREVEALRAQLDDRDRVLVSVLAYAGLRPAEALALRWDHVREGTLLVARACDLEAGAMKTTKAGGHRVVRLLAPLAADLAEWRLRSGRPQGTAEVFPAADCQPWAKGDWKNWRVRRWRPALTAAGLPVSRPNDLRHSFASLLLAEGRTVHYVAARPRSRADVADLRARDRRVRRPRGIVAEDEIRVARGHVPSESGPKVARSV